MDRQKWLKWRKEGIGGSDSAVILKLFPFGKTPYQLWQEKTSDEIVDFENAATKHGKDYEDRALDWFEKKTGAVIFRQVPAENKEHPWIRCTLDGIDVEQEFMVEAKCPYNLANHIKVKATRKVPDIYYPQCQHQMKTKELHKMRFLSFNYQDPDDSVILEVIKDDKFIEKMMPEYEKFWKCVQDKTPPPLTELDYTQLHEDKEWLKYSDLHKEFSKIAKDAQQDADVFKERMIEVSKGKSAEGNGVRMTKSICPGRIDYEQAIIDYIENMKAHYPEINFPPIPLEPYRKESFTKWSIRSISEK